METLIHGDCLEKLKEIPDNSIDSIVTDPPYGLSFMGKKWDYDVPSIEIWQECLRVLKPGGHLLSFAGTRTQHRMAVRIEDAGFEIRDMIAWVYGSGFPKSLNIGKSVNQLETNEWSKISKALDNTDQKSIMEVWKTNAKPAGIQLSKSLTEVGINTPRKFFVPDIAVLYSNQKNELLNAIIAEMRLKGLSLILEEKGIIAVESAGQTIELLPENARLAVKLSESPNRKCWNIFTAECDVKEWLNENTEVNHKVDEALKTLRGNKKYSNEEITSVLCAELTDILKLTILSQSNTFQNLDTKSQMDFLSAINVIITEYTAENLISNTVAILKSKAVDKIQGNEREIVGENKNTKGRTTKGKDGMSDYGGFTGEDKTTLTKGHSEWEGWGTALKPALEPITVARKPIEGTVAENCLKWGVGGINIDESRVGLNGEENPSINRRTSRPPINNVWNDARSPESYAQERPSESLGRWPANLIHDGSEEVLECFPNSKSSPFPDRKSTGWKNTSDVVYGGGFKEDGSAARFFKACSPTLEYDSMSVCKHTNANNVELALRTIRATIGNTAPLNVEGWLDERLVQNVKSAGIVCQRCATSIAQELAKIRSLVFKNEGSLATPDFIGNFKNSIPILNLASIVAVWESIDTTPTTQNLSQLFGSVLLATDENTSSERKEAVGVSGEPKRLGYFPKASKKDRDEGLEGFEEKQQDESRIEGNPGGDNPRNRGVNKVRNFHPTVKPTELMRYLVKLVTPPIVFVCEQCYNGLYEKQEKTSNPKELPSVQGGFQAERQLSHREVLQPEVFVPSDEDNRGETLQKLQENFSTKKNGQEGADLLLSPMLSNGNGSRKKVGESDDNSKGVQSDLLSRTPDGKQTGSYNGTQVDSVKTLGEKSQLLGGSPSQEREKNGQQDRESGGYGQEATRSVTEAKSKTNPVSSLPQNDKGFGTCKKCGGNIVKRAGLVLDPFCGSGSTGKACKLEGFNFIGVEREEEYVKIARARIEAVSYTPTLL